VKFVLPIVAVSAMVSAASAAPDAETAKRCLRAAYLRYPYERPGAAPMNGGRLFYFKECVARHDGGPPSPAR
jgi:hypothetical protein